MTTHPEDADKWFVNLETIADRIDSNEQHYRQNFRRICILAAFVLFAFLLLAWRSEINSNRISATQDRSCLGEKAIQQKFNVFLDDQIAVERDNPFIDDQVRRERITAYRDARNFPLPACREDAS